MLPLRMVKLSQLRDEFFLVSQWNNFHFPFLLTLAINGRVKRGPATEGSEFNGFVKRAHSTLHSVVEIKNQIHESRSPYPIIRNLAS